MDDGTTAFLVIFWESIEPAVRVANMLIIYDAFDAHLDVMVVGTWMRV